MSNHPSIFSAIYEPEVEEWKGIPGLEGYQASSFGNIRTCWDSRMGVKKPRMTDVWQAVKVSDGSSGYLCFKPVRIKGTKPRTCSVHRSVCLAFHGEPPPGYWIEAAHFPDQDKHNNRADNLSWKTRKENQKDRIVNGTHFRGENSPRARLKDEDVLKIRALAGKMFQRDIAKMFGISQPHVHRIISGNNWQYLVEA